MGNNKPPHKTESKLIPQDVEDRARDEITLDATDSTDAELEALYGESLDDMAKRTRPG